MVRKKVRALDHLHYASPGEERIVHGMSEIGDTPSKLKGLYEQRVRLIVLGAADALALALGDSLPKAVPTSSNLESTPSPPIGGPSRARPLQTTALRIAKTRQAAARRAPNTSTGPKAESKTKPHAKASSKVKSTPKPESKSKPQSKPSPKPRPNKGSQSKNKAGSPSGGASKKKNKTEKRVRRSLPWQ